MQQDGKVQQVRSRFDQRVVRHKIGIEVELPPAVVCEQLQVAEQVDHQKCDEEQTRQAHDHFAANGRAEKKVNQPFHKHASVKRWQSYDMPGKMPLPVLKKCRLSADGLPEILYEVASILHADA
jgi:hypothetical protein